MKKIMDKLINNVRFDKRYVFFCLILVILGIITGAFFIVILNSTDKSLVIEYIKSFIESLKVNKFDYFGTLKNTLIINYSIIIIISILGFTYFLAPFNILILFYKSFIIGFSLSSFVLTYKLKGMILSIIYIFPHLIINILLISLITAFTLKLSINMIKNIIKKRDVNMRQYFDKYLYIIIFFIVLISVSSVYESLVVPFLLKNIIKILI